LLITWFIYNEVFSIFLWIEIIIITFAHLKKSNYMNHYETVFILNPVLSDTQIEETVKKFEDFLINNGAKMVAKENWGLKKLAYPIQNKKSGFYHLFEFTNTGEVVTPYEQEFRRDERVMRFLTVKLDKHAISWAERRRTRNKKTAKA
jgi:small subunit ribosomal protein S6